MALAWLASAITRNPVLVALVTVGQRLPWLIFSLPAGVITDRYSRRLLMVGANGIRAVLGSGLALAVWLRRNGLPDAEVVGQGAATGAGVAPSEDMTLYVVMILVVLTMGFAEVVYDNSSQTFVPSILPSSQLEKGNGRLWSSEMVANELVGPPLGAVLVGLLFALPFIFDSLTFALSALLILVIDPGRLVRPDRTSGDNASGEDTAGWREDLMEGLRWLWGHGLLRTLAIVLGIMNMLGTMTFSTLVLFSQEILGTSTREFALMGTGGAVGGALGGWTASRISSTIGDGPSLYTTLGAGIVVNAVIGLTSSWPLVWLLMFVYAFTAVLWNVITVSLRQTIIPDELLGRVNSVYRFFGWGAMPVGAALGGLLVLVNEPLVGRELALRTPWLMAAVANGVLLVVAWPRLKSARLAHARQAAETSGPVDGSDVSG